MKIKKGELRAMLIEWREEETSLETSQINNSANKNRREDVLCLFICMSYLLCMESRQPWQHTAVAVKSKFCALINIKSNEIPSRFIRTPLRGSEELLLNEAPAYVSMYMPSHNNSVYNTIKQMSSIFPNFVIVSYGEKSAREEWWSMHASM